MQQIRGKASDRCSRSGGKGRRPGGLAADHADGAAELDPVGVDVGLGGRPADQGADRVVGQQVPLQFLKHQVRALGPQHLAGPARRCVFN
ncbi:MAG: hypothetical protein JWL58_7291 [Streptosporangiaceae bacterium]|nr:hypothetical protein [Streptosporangiaceae bacterium]